MNDPRLALAGLVTGVLVGMTGMGGGSLMTPILIFFFNFNPSAAIGTDILHGAIFKSFGAVRHRRLGTVRARLGAWMLVGSAPASLLGVWVATYLTDRYGDSVDSVQGQVLGYTLLFGAVAFVVKAFTHRGGSAASLGRLSRRDRLVAVAIGVVGGFIVGLTSVGSGTLFALAMLLAFPLAAKFVVGTDIFHAAALLFVAGLGHLVAGNVDLPAIGWLLLGSIPGVLIGSQISVGLPETALRMALATALALSGLKLLDVPRANEIVVVSLGAGLVALVVSGIVHLARRSKSRRAPPSPPPPSLTPSKNPGDS
ncbi:MAG: sulfite exporter TauE/SafE family protein [Gaiellaceae bacterium]